MATLQTPDGVITIPDGLSPQQVESILQARQSEKTIAARSRVGNLGDAILEPALAMGSGMAGSIAGGLAGLGTAVAKGLGMTQAQPANVVRSVGDAMTYRPRTMAGEVGNRIASYPFEKLAQGANYVGEKIADVNSNPGGAADFAGAAFNAGLQFLPALLLKGRGKPSARIAEGTQAAETAAQSYVARTTGLDWNSLSASLQESLTQAARNAKDLAGIDPAAIKRQAALESLPKPMTATRGQLTQDPVQLRNEGNVSATEAGKPIREIYVAQNKAILDNLQVLKNDTGATAATAEQTGTVVQGAARAKLKYQEARVSRLYSAAEKSPETLQKVDVTPLIDLIEKTPDVTQYGWAQTWMKKVGGEPGSGISIRDLESLRKAAVAKTKNGGEAAHYAGQLIQAIDAATEGAGGKLYKAARAARRQQGLEFSDQAGVARLVTDKSRTDRAVALEDTWRRTVVGGSIEDLTKVRDSLLKGGTPRTRALGELAWREMQGQTLQHIITKSTESVAKFEDGTPNITTDALKRAINSVGKDKIDVQFGAGMYAKLQQILDATRIVKTEPPTGFKGSPTVANALALLEKGVGKLPLIGNTTAGVVQAVSKLNASGKAAAQVRTAQSTPLAEAAARNALAAQTKNTLLESSYYGIPATSRDKR